MTVYEDARARVKMFFEILSLAQPDSAGMREVGVPQEVVDALGILTQVPEAPVVNLVSDSYRGTNATGIRLGELEQAVREIQDSRDLLAERIRDLEDGCAPAWTHRLITSYLSGEALDFQGVKVPDDVRIRLEKAFPAPRWTYESEDDG